MFTICEMFPADHVKAEKKQGFRWLFPRYLQFCVFFLYLKFGPINVFLSTGTRKSTNMFNGLANLWKFHRRERDKYHSRDSYFLCRKIFRNGIELPQDLYLSMRKLSNLSPFCNLSHRVFFSVCLFLFWHRNPINFIGAFAGNPRFYHIKTVWC